MFRKFVLFSMVALLSITTVACGDNGGDRANSSTPKAQPVAQPNGSPQIQSSKLADGQYPVQQASYNDVDGEYSLMLLNTPAGASSVYRTTNIPMARLTDEEVTAGQKSFLKLENGQPSLHLASDFQIQYQHNVTETQVNPQSGEKEVVVVRQESSFWTPFAGALAGQVVGNLLFRPQYYVPPMYQPGGTLTGFGGYGPTYNQAVDTYRQRYNQPPAEVRNRTAFRTTGRIRSPQSTPVQSRSRAPQSTKVQSPVRTRPGDRSTGSGYGSSTLRRDPSRSTVRKSRPSSSTRFGTSKGGRRTSSFGSRRR